MPANPAPTSYAAATLEGRAGSRNQRVVAEEWLWRQLFAMSARVAMVLRLRAVPARAAGIFSFEFPWPSG
jgi:hypothetical protein